MSNYKLLFTSSFCALPIFFLGYHIDPGGDYGSYLEYFSYIGDCQAIGCLIQADSIYFQSLIRDPYFKYIVFMLPFSPEINILLLVSICYFLLFYFTLSRTLVSGYKFGASALLLLFIVYSLVPIVVAANLLRQVLAASILYCFFFVSTAPRLACLLSASFLHYSTVGLFLLANLSKALILPLIALIFLFSPGYLSYASQQENISFGEISIYIILLLMNFSCKENDLLSNVCKGLCVIGGFLFLAGMTFPFERTLIVLEVFSIRNAFIFCSGFILKFNPRYFVYVVSLIFISLIYSLRMV